MELQNNIKREELLEDLKALNEICIELVKSDQYSKEGLKVIRPQLIELLEDMQSGKFLEDYNFNENEMNQLRSNFQNVLDGMNKFEELNINGR
jgi:hypothetical protein